jgi:VIT1/CCC1 family predicted Fe2+/Mn2+ transporter
MLSWISSDFFARSPLLALPVIALLLFMAVFAAAAVRAAIANRSQLERMARMPLEDESEARHG